MTWHNLREENKTQKKVIERQAEEIRKLQREVDRLKNGRK